MIRQAQAGNHEAMDRLLAVLKPYLDEVARGYSDPARPAESTSDLVQEAWLRAWRRLDQFRGGDSPEETEAMFQAWICRIVRRIGINARRDRETLRRSPLNRSVLSLDRWLEATDSGEGCRNPGRKEPTPSDLAASDETASRVYGALAAVPDEKDREIVRLRFFEGLSLREISRRLGIGYDQARGRYSRGIRRLEAELGDML